MQVPGVAGYFFPVSSLPAPTLPSHLLKDILHSGVRAISGWQKSSAVYWPIYNYLLKMQGKLLMFQEIPDRNSDRIPDTILRIVLNQSDKLFGYYQHLPVLVARANVLSLSVFQV